MTAVNVTTAFELSRRILRAKRVPMLWGHGGLGKSSIAKMIAIQHNLELVDVRLSTYDPVFLDGIIDVGTTNAKVNFRPIKVFPLASDPIPEGKRGWLLFLDELSGCAPATQVAAYRLVLDREHAGHKLHPNCHIMCAGNMVTSGAVAFKMSTAMSTRLVHFEVTTDYKEWVNWANKEGLDSRVVSYINSKPDHLHVHSNKPSSFTYRCPRSWHILSDSIKGDSITHKDKALVEGCIGQDGAMDFIGFSQVFQDVPQLDQILSDPMGVSFKDSPNINYAISGVIASHFNEANAESFMLFIGRLPIEFQAMTMRMVVHKFPEIDSVDCVSNWLMLNHGKLY